MQQPFVIIRRAWRAEIFNLAIFFVLAMTAVAAKELLPSSIIVGELIRIGDTRVILHLPLFAVASIVPLAMSVYRIFNAYYILDFKGIESREGVLSFKYRTSRVSYDDIRGVEMNQSLWGRIINFGTVEVGTAATDDVEVVIRDVVNPRALKDFINSERDDRQRVARTASAAASATSPASAAAASTSTPSKAA